jgi:cytochrome c-type biogenesis protein CcmH/NrfG
MTERKPDEPRGWIALANVYEKQEKPLEAEKALRKSLEVDPANLRIYAALARSMRNRGDKDGAIGVYREMLRQAPDDHSTLSRSPRRRSTTRTSRARSRRWSGSRPAIRPISSR